MEKKLVITKSGKEEIKAFIRECKAKRKEILDAGKDTAYETILPTKSDIKSDIKWFGIDEEGDYFSTWGVTDNYNSSILHLRLGYELVYK